MSTSTKTAGASAGVSYGGSNESWTNLSRATGAQDGLYAGHNQPFSPYNAGVVTNWLYVSNFGFAIPSGQRITAVEISPRLRSNLGYLSPNPAIQIDWTLGLTTDGTSLFSTETYSKSYAADTQPTPEVVDLARTVNNPSLSVADINATAFGVMIRGQCTTDTGTGSGQGEGWPEVDFVSITVTYVPFMRGDTDEVIFGV